MKRHWLRNFWKSTKCKFGFHSWVYFDYHISPIMYPEWTERRRHCDCGREESYWNRIFDYYGGWIRCVSSKYKPTETDIVKKLLEEYE